MAKLNEKAKKIIAESGPALIATASKEGKPNVLPKGSFRVLDDEHVIFDRSTRKGCRIWGKAEVLHSGELFDSISAEYADGDMKVKHLVKVTVEEAATF